MNHCSNALHIRKSFWKNQDDVYTTKIKLKLEHNIKEYHVGKLRAQIEDFHVQTTQIVSTFFLVI